MYEEINELKRQRVQLEAGLRAVVDTQSRFLDAMFAPDEDVVDLDKVISRARRSGHDGEAEQSNVKSLRASEQV